MNKYLLFVASLVVAAVCFSAQASAHVLIKDSVSGAGSILHVNPDDDPIAGEPASLFFDIRGNAIDSDSVSKLTITDAQGKVVAVKTETRGSGISATYVFPTQGQYSLQLNISQGDTLTHRFVQSQRVSRGIIGGVSTDKSYPLAEIGILATAVGAGLTAIIAFNRRQAINTYSKW